MSMPYEEAVSKLKRAVKESAVEGQKHLDLTLVDPIQRDELQKALMFVKAMIVRGEITDAQFKSDVGLDS